MRRQIFALALFLWLTPVLAVGVAGIGLARSPALIVGAVAAAVAAAVLSRSLERALVDPVAASPPIAVVLALATVVSILRFGSVSIFMADVQRAGFAVSPQDPFRSRHSCVSAYAESARLLEERHHNIYDRRLYVQNATPREIGPLRVDPFHYPPPFLLLPQAVRWLAPDFWDFRRVWFAIQALTLAAAIVGLAAWIGGRAGAIALLGGILMLSLPHAAFTFQQGNFQITAMPLTAIAFVLLLSGYGAGGGGLLAYAALAKIFPGILAVLLVTGRHWRAAAWVAGMGAAILALTLALQGIQPMRDFISTALPEISNGSAFPQTETPQHSRVNWSAYGQTVRLRQMGVAWLTLPRGLMIAQLYGIAVVALAGWAGWKRRFDLTEADDRIALLLLILGLVGLASFRSPFVGATYGCLSTLWVMSIAAARSSTPKGAIGWLCTLYALGAVVWVMPSPADPLSVAWIWISGGLVAMCMAISVWAVVAAVRVRPQIHSLRSAALGSTADARLAGT